MILTGLKSDCGACGDSLLLTLLTLLPRLPPIEVTLNYANEPEDSYQFYGVIPTRVQPFPYSRIKEPRQEADANKCYNVD